MRSIQSNITEFATSLHGICGDDYGRFASDDLRFENIYQLRSCLFNCLDELVVMLDIARENNEDYEEDLERLESLFVELDDDQTVTEIFALHNEAFDNFLSLRSFSEQEDLEELLEEISHSVSLSI